MSVSFSLRLKKKLCHLLNRGEKAGLSILSEELQRLGVHLLAVVKVDEFCIFLGTNDPSVPLVATEGFGAPLELGALPQLPTPRTSSEYGTVGLSTLVV